MKFILSNDKIRYPLSGAVHSVWTYTNQNKSLNFCMLNDFKDVFRFLREEMIIMAYNDIVKLIVTDTDCGKDYYYLKRPNGWWFMDAPLSGNASVLIVEDKGKWKRMK